MKQSYVKPIIIDTNGTVYGFPTVLAVGAVAAAVGASSVAVGKMIGNDIARYKNVSHRQIKGLL